MVQLSLVGVDYEINLFFIGLPPKFLSVLGPCTQWCASTMGAALLCSSRAGSDSGLLSRQELRALSIWLLIPKDLVVGFIVIGFIVYYISSMLPCRWLFFSVLFRFNHFHFFFPPIIIVSPHRIFDSQKFELKGWWQRDSNLQPPERWCRPLYHTAREEKNVSVLFINIIKN